MQTPHTSSPIILAFILMGIIMMMILPMPAWILDIGLAASFSLAILMFTVTLFIQRPLDFSAFPTILLGSLILRLSLNIASTKLIIGEGYTGTHAAGNVIEGFALFVMNGSIALGLVIFCVLLMINFLVINKGATRMAEVGARFALDAMPGKQLAIDSDLASGAITHEEAKERRQQEQAETTFFGSLDGASKFVKGDAIAGLLITVLNLMVGLAVGIISHKMNFSSAFATYSILTVGDGLVSQIPAVLISVASALLLARGGSTKTTDTAVGEQLGRYPLALLAVAVLLTLLAFIPGLPFIPFILASTILLWVTYLKIPTEKNKRIVDTENSLQKVVEDAAPSLADVMETDEIHIDFSPSLTSMVLNKNTGLDMRIANIRSHIANEYGVLLPEIRLTDNHSLETGEYVIKILNVTHGRYILRPDHVLVLSLNGETEFLNGHEVTEPVFHAPALWIKPEQSEEATLSGLSIVQPAEVLATHLLEVLKQNFPKILTLSALQGRITAMTSLENASKSAANKKLVDSLIPEKLPLELLHATLKSLLAEKISIRNLQLIMEAIAEGRQLNQDWNIIYEHVRMRLGFQIIDNLKDTNECINVIQLAQEWEQIFMTYQTSQDRGGRSDVSLPPKVFQNLTNEISKSLDNCDLVNDKIAIVTNSARRRFISTILAAKDFKTPVIAYEEIETGVKINLLGVINA